MDLQRTSTIRIACPRGLGPYLEREVAALGCAIEAAEDTGVEISGNVAECMRLNLYLRVATAVLLQVDRFAASTPDAMYDRLAALPWEDLISPEEYLTIVSTVDTPTISDSRFASRRAKDAIVDRIADRKGCRPDSGPERDNVVINIYWRGDDCRVYINTTGRKLADRNYRKIPHKAPMQETLAAAVVLETGYDGTQPLVNPMCGSGTLAIEAALIATGRPPGLLRSNFGFKHLSGFDDAAWQAIRAEARKVRKGGTPAAIVATDIDDRAVRAAEQNAKTAGVDHLIQFKVCDFAETAIPQERGIVLLNPEYGERMGQERELEGTYARIGDFFKQKCSGWTGYVFTGNPNLAKRVGLKAGRRIPFWNANIECRLLKYDLYEGTRRKPREQSE